MIFDNLTSPPDKLNGCVDNLTVLPINIFNYFVIQKKYNTRSHSGKTKEKNKMRAIGGMGAGGREEANFKA